MEMIVFNTTAIIEFFLQLRRLENAMRKEEG